LGKKEEVKRSKGGIATGTADVETGHVDNMSVLRWTYTGEKTGRPPTCGKGHANMGWALRGRKQGASVKVGGGRKNHCGFLFLWWDCLKPKTLARPQKVAKKEKTTGRTKERGRVTVSKTEDREAQWVRMDLKRHHEKKSGAQKRSQSGKKHSKGISQNIGPFVRPGKLQKGKIKGSEMKGQKQE